jgi:hypothetical protein
MGEIFKSPQILSRRPTTMELVSHSIVTSTTFEGAYCLLVASMASRVEVLPCIKSVVEYKRWLEKKEITYRTFEIPNKI